MKFSAFFWTSIPALVAFVPNMAAAADACKPGAVYCGWYLIDAMRMP
jgi:hypothetical protein